MIEIHVQLLIINMKKMKKTHIAILLFILMGCFSKAQVKDISFTLSPAAEYTWWDNKAGLEDNLMVGGKLGFGFGEYVELRGIYLQSLDLKTDFNNFGISGFDASLFNAQNITLTRWGGEFKANFGTKGIKPYLTLGAGVQNIKIENSGDFEQVYGNFGLGAIINLSKRIVFALEVKNTTYNFNSGMNLLSDNDKLNFGVTNADFQNERLANWSAQGSLQFYLGGRKPGTLSELDKAYLQNFKGGFKGIQFVIEPSLAYTKFAKESLFRDTYWLGGYVGLDLNEYIGIRAFYFKATQDEQISTDFDKLAMYGGEFRARLNDGNGVIPFLILGGGYLNPDSDYVSLPDSNGNPTTVGGGEFATGGLGLSIPLGKHILITGGARAMLTSGENVADITNTDNIQTHIFYNAGLKFTLGRKAKAPSTVYQQNLDRALTNQEQENNQKLSKLRQEYQSKIEGLETDLKLAYETKDVDKAVEILEEKKEVEEALGQVESVAKVQEKVVANKTPTSQTTPVSNLENTKTENSKLIQMTPMEFESLIDRILNKVNETSPSTNQQKDENQLDVNPTIQNDSLNQLKERVELLEKLLLELNSKQGAALNTEKIQPSSIDQKEEMNNIILDKLDKMNRKVDHNSNQIQSDSNQPQTIIVTPTQKKEDSNVNIKLLQDNQGIIEDAEIQSDTISLLKYKHSSAILGFNYGGASTANIGFRLHYEIKNTKLMFMPEAYLGFGKANSWALSGNITYPIEIKNEKFKPYVGVGLGFGNFVSGTTGFYNIILGSMLPVLNESLYVDYTMRNSFKYNQIAVGYNFKF